MTGTSTTLSSCRRKRAAHIGLNVVEVAAALDRPSRSSWSATDPRTVRPPHLWTWRTTVSAFPGYKTNSGRDTRSCTGGRGARRAHRTARRGPRHRSRLHRPGGATFEAAPIDAVLGRSVTGGVRRRIRRRSDSYSLLFQVRPCAFRVRARGTQVGAKVFRREMLDVVRPPPPRETPRFRP